MFKHLRQLWPVMKAILALAILVGVGWQFVKILRRSELWEEALPFRPAWLLLAGLLYLVGLGFSALFWYRLMRILGEEPPVPAMVRAYFIGHLGKYAPGKAWALLMRTTMAHEAGVRMGTAAMTATYETLTTMASGAFVAAILFGLLLSDGGGMGWKALGLLALAGIPILPGVFNELVRRLARPFLDPAAGPLPRLRTPTLLSGLALTACGWGVLGTSLWAVLQALLPEPPAWNWADWTRCVAFVAVAYVAGFLALPAPGGLGVREVILQQLLAPELGRHLGPERGESLAVVVVLVLRLLWTVAELVMAGLVWRLPRHEKTRMAVASAPAPAEN